MARTGCPGAAEASRNRYAILAEHPLPPVYERLWGKHSGTSSLLLEYFRGREACEAYVSVIEHWTRSSEAQLPLRPSVDLTIFACAL